MPTIGWAAGPYAGGPWDGAYSPVPTKDEGGTGEKKWWEEEAVLPRRKPAVLVRRDEEEESLAVLAWCGYL